MTRYLTLLVSCFLFLSGCNPSSEISSPEPENSAVAPLEEDKTLKLLYWQAPTILNPHLSNGDKDSEASRITLEPLASYDKNGEIILFLGAEVPSIENGGLAEDGKSVTWKLKEGVKWSDGTPFTAADVVFTYEFVSNPDVGALTAGTYDIVESVEALDDYTVKVNFKEVNPSWFLVFMGPEGMILPKHLFESFNGANAREAPNNLVPVGTGPYRVVKFVPGDVVVYEKNPEFRDAQQLGFERIELKGGGDANSAARAVLQTGDADFAYNLQVEAKVLTQLAAAGQGEVVANFGAQMERALMNQTDPNRATEEGERSNLKFPHPFLSDRKVRQAFSLAMDRDAVANQLYGTTGQATSNFVVAPESYVSGNTSYEFNLDKAASLLDEAGWIDSNGNGTRDQDGVEMQVVFQTSVNPLRQKTQAIIKQSLTSIGVDVELKSIDASVYFSADPGNTETVEHFYADLQMFTTGNTNPDPTSYLQTYTCAEIAQKSNGWSGTNSSRYCNPDYDSLWEQVTQELDSEKRQQLFIEMNDLLVNDFVVIPLVHRARTVGVSQNLKGINLTPWDMNTWNIKDWIRPRS